MTKFALKGLLTRKLRTVLTALAIVLGVAMISGTFVLTDSIDSAFDQIFTDVRQGLERRDHGEVGLRPLRRQRRDGPDARRVAARRRCATLPDVAQAEGSVDSDSTSLIGKDGKAIVFGGAPNLGFSIADGDSPFNPLRLVEGNWPKTDEVVIDKATADKKDFEIGDEIGVQVEGPVREAQDLGDRRVRLRPLDRRRDARGLRPADGADGCSRRRASSTRSRSRRSPGSPTNSSCARSGRSCRRTRKCALGPAAGREDAADTNSFISFLRGFLLAFGGIALFVGSFVIANSLSITIAQRTREFATLRTLGASRRQVLRSIIVEALVVGFVASVSGCSSACCSRRACSRCSTRSGSRFRTPGSLFETRTAVVALLVGDPRHADREPPSGDPRDARPADRRGARGRDAAARPLRPFPRRRRGPDRAPRLRGASLRPLRERSRDDPDPLLDGARGASHLPGRRALLVAAGEAARRGARLAGDADRRRGRAPRARQRAAQPAAHRLDGGGADDRARARDARRHARGRDRQRRSGAR